MEDLSFASSLPKQVLSTFQDPHYNPSSEQYDIVSSLLQATEPLSRHLSPLINLDEFIDLARWHLNLEVLPHGKVLYKEQDYINKFYLVLDGKVDKLKQKPFEEIEQAIKENELRSFLLTQSEAFNPGLKIQLKLRRNNSFRSTKGLNDSMDSAGSAKLASKFKILQSNQGQKSKAESIKAESSPKSNKISIKLDSDFSFSDDNHSGNSKAGSSQNSPRIMHDGNQCFSPIAAKQNFSSFSGKKNDQFKARASNFFYQSKFGNEGENTPRNVKEEVDSWQNSPKRGVIQHIQHEKLGEKLEKLNDVLPLVNKIIEQYPEAENRCLIKGVSRLFCSQSYTAGQSFGENFSRHYMQKENSFLVVASEEAYALTLTRESFLAIVQELKSKTTAKTKFFCKVFPSFKDVTVVKFSKCWNEKTLQKGEVIYRPTERVDKSYLVASGEVRLSQEKNGLQSPKLGRKGEVPLAHLREGQLFGEELLLNEQFSRYLVTANSPDTKVYYLEGQAYKENQDKFMEFFDILKKQAEKRLEWRQERAVAAVRSNSQKSGTVLQSPVVNMPQIHKLSRVMSPSLRTEPSVATVNSEESSQFSIRNVLQRGSWADITLQSERSSVIAKKVPTYLSKVVSYPEAQKKEGSGNGLYKVFSFPEKPNKEKEKTQKKERDASIINELNIRKELFEKPTSPSSTMRMSFVKSPRHSHTSSVTWSGVSLKTNHSSVRSVTEQSATSSKKEDVRPCSSNNQKLAKFSYVSTTSLKGSIVFTEPDASVNKEKNKSVFVPSLEKIEGFGTSGKSSNKRRRRLHPSSLVVDKVI